MRAIAISSKNPKYIANFITINAVFCLSIALVTVAFFPLSSAWAFSTGTELQPTEVEIEVQLANQAPLALDEADNRLTNDSEEASRAALDYGSRKLPGQIESTAQAEQDIMQ